MTMRDNWRKCNRSKCLLGTAAVLAVVAMVAEGLAAGRVEKQRQAERLVHEALAHESLGLTEQRNRLLAEASATAPDYAPANWHQGRIRVGRKINGDCGNRTSGGERKRPTRWPASWPWPIGAHRTG
jgi:hypothetical protein